MKKFALAFAAAAVVGVSGPALAGSVTATTDKPIVLAQSATIVTRDRGPSITIRTRDNDRWERRRERRWMARDRGCRTVTIREKRGNRTIVKRIERC